MENDRPKFGMQLAAGAANTLLGQVGGMIFGKAQDRRQLKQQEKLQKLQIAGNKELADYEQQLAMDMWDATNLPAQVDKAKEAGMSISALYGGKGAGGATTAGGSAGSASGTAAGDPNAGVGMGLQMASQLALMEAQKENIEADTQNKKAKAENTGAATTGINFQNEVNSKISAQKIADRYHTESDKIETEQQRANAEWEAFQAAGFKGKTFDDPESPLAKALKAGWETTEANLKKAKAEGNVQEATAVIEGYKANLAKNGISPDTPWYYKILGDLLDKNGLLPNFVKK